MIVALSTLKYYLSTVLGKGDVFLFCFFFGGGRFKDFNHSCVLDRQCHLWGQFCVPKSSPCTGISFLAPEQLRSNTYPYNWTDQSSVFALWETGLKNNTICLKSCTVDLASLNTYAHGDGVTGLQPLQGCIRPFSSCTLSAPFSVVSALAPASLFCSPAVGRSLWNSRLP